MRPEARALVCLTAALAGCPTYKADYIACTKDAECPNGYGCDTAGFCFSFATPPPSCPSGGCEVDAGPLMSGCATNADCSADPATPVCDTAIGTCVECVQGNQCAAGFGCLNNECIAAELDAGTVSDAGEGDAGTVSDAGAGLDAGTITDAGLPPDGGVPTIVFTAPAITAGTNPPVADVGGTSPVAVAVTTNLPLASVVITYDNDMPLTSWTTNPTGLNFTQQVDWATTPGLGMHLLTAVATNTLGDVAQATIEIDVVGPQVVFIEPTITVGTNPPVADVSGTSHVEVNVTTFLPLTSVVITYDGGMPLAFWTTNLTGPTFSLQVDWATTLGSGIHMLTIVVTDNAGETAKATLSVLVATPACTTDANCTNGERCSPSDGTCNPTVAPGGDCDGDHPCPTDQGCFPGVCGATPQKCFTGCFPGSTSGTGQVPSTCAPINGQPAFCLPLPASQVTTQNQGGACVPGDNCSVTMQNCPTMPLDRSQPQGANNPLVAYNCVPVYPGVNGCFPAGALTMGAIICSQQCGSVASGIAAVQDNCAAGYECISPVDSAGAASGPAACQPQCSDPSMTGAVSSGCPGGHETCMGVYQPYGQQMVDFSTGACCIPPAVACTSVTASSCCSGTCTRNACE